MKIKVQKLYLYTQQQQNMISHIILQDIQLLCSVLSNQKNPKNIQFPYSPIFIPQSQNANTASMYPLSQTIEQQLKLTSDRFDRIIPNICNNFIKKYQKNPELYGNSFLQDVRLVQQQLDVYIQHVYEIVKKFQMIGQFEGLVRSVIEGQAALIGFLGNLVNQGIKDKTNFITKIENMTNRAYERCQNCTLPLQKAQIQSVQTQIGLRFRDVHSYFSHDVDQINKLSEQASLLVRKKSLNIEGIAEEQYIIKLQKVYENINTTIQYVTNSINNITKFQQKFGQIQQYQYSLEKGDQFKLYETKNKFNTKKYTLDLTKHFYDKIRILQQKIAKIKTYFVNVISTETQTQNQFDKCTPQFIQSLQKTISDIQNEKRQLQMSNSYLDKQVREEKLKCKNLQDNNLCMKNQKQKLEENIKSLQIQVEKLQCQKNVKNIDEIFNEQMKLSEKIRELKQQEQKNNKNLNQKIENSSKQNQKNDDFASVAIKKMLRGYASSNKQKKNIESLQKKNVDKTAGKMTTSKIKTENSVSSVESKNTSRKTKDLSKTFQSFKKQVEDPKNSTVRRSENISPKKQSFIKKKLSQIKNQPIFKPVKGVPNKKGSQITKTIRQQDDQHQSQLIQLPEEPQQFNQIDYYRQIYHSLKNYNLNIKPYVSEGRFVQEISSFIHQIINNGHKHYDLASNFGKRFSVNRGSFLFGKNSNKKLSSLSKFGEELGSSRKAGKALKMSDLGLVNENDQQFKRLIKKKLQEKKQKQSSQNSQESQESVQQKQQKPSKMVALSTQQQPKKLKKALRTSQIWPSQTTTQNRPFIETLPLLKSNIRTSGDEVTLHYNPIDINKFIQQLQFPITQLDFGEKDIRIIFRSIKNAYQYGKSMMKDKGKKKHKRNQTCGESLLMNVEMCFVKEVVNRLAHLHLINKQYYEKIKQFLICPYESFITQMAEPGLTKSSSTSTLRQCIKDILYMHRKCTVRGQICKHLRYLFVKIVSFQRNMLITNNTKLSYDKENVSDT